MPGAKLLLEVLLLRNSLHLLASPPHSSDLIAQASSLLSRLLPVEHALSRKRLFLMLDTTQRILCRPPLRGGT